MRSAARQTLGKFSLAWLIGLALLVPLAQAAAAWHAVSHVGATATSRTDEPPSPHPASCELCLVAAAIGGGGLPTAAQALALPTASEAPAIAAVVDLWVAPPAAAYSSRAPPHSLR